MNIIKLNATESTNTFLKELCKHKELDNFTVVVTRNQTKGRGQMNAVWSSEVGKNITFSILIKFNDFEIKNQFYLSKVISLAIYECLKPFLNINLTIKWPNDIMAGQSKIAGILIENSVKQSKIIQSVIGVGLNVNQEVFENVSYATSMKLITRRNFDLDFLLNKLVKSFKRNIELLNAKQFDLIDVLYLDKLFKLNVPAMYKDKNGNQFMGKIGGVSTEGKLQIELENGKTFIFNLKEIEYERL